MLIPPARIERYWHGILILIAVLIVLFTFVSLTFGAVPLDLHDVLNSLIGNGDPLTQTVVNNLRLPRVLLALLVGAVLASCGAMAQGLFRNPLADPSLIGIGAGASAGASLVIVFLNHVQWSYWGLSLVSLGAFCGAAIAVTFVYRIATGPTGTSVATMLLVGIAVTYLVGSVSSLLEFIADNEMLRRISLWRMGGMEAADYSRVIIAACVALAIFCFFPFCMNTLNVMLLGESEARHLGVNVDKAKKLIVLAIAAGVGCAVALAGSISFIGLIVPHIVRVTCGPNHRYLLPLSACLGALLLLCADTFARTVIAPTELPVGLVTSFIGAPIFISLLRHRHRYGM